MASNDQWPPVSLASAKTSARANGNKRHVKEAQQETLKKLNEMFGSTLEPEVILSVVQNCNWELQPSIEGLITLSETVEDPPMWNDSASEVENVGLLENKEESRKNNEKTIIEKDHVSSSRENLSSVPSPWEEVSRGKTWGKPKKSGTKNRMDSFCGNIAKLKSSGEKIGESDKSSSKTKEKNDGSIVANADLIFESRYAFGATGRASFPTTMLSERGSHGDVPDKPIKSKALSPGKEKTSLSSPEKRGNNRREKKSDRSEKSGSPEEPKDLSVQNQKVARFDNKMNMRKNESESLCGLKVQYRLNGMSSSDDDNEDDDDADVVIEDETSDYKINLTSAITSSVSQFLSPSTQTPPRRTKPEIHMINTPSPPRTPQRSVHDATFARIKAAITRGDKILVLLRGLPGSGKTTLAKSLVSTTVGGNVASHVFSSDDFFVTLGRGVYKFDPTKLSDAHTTNRSKVSKAMRDGRTPIIVDNTNIEAWEMRPYAAMAVDSGYIVEILEPNTPWARNPKQLAEKNTHNITKAKISERALKFELIMSGQKLLDMYGLKYSKRNEPSPQIEREKGKPPARPPPSSMADVKSNWENDDKNNYVLTSHDIESMQNIDETRYKSSNAEQSPIDTDRASSSDYSETNLPEKMSSYADNAFKDYLKELQDSDDESFEIVDGSGTENRLSFEQCIRDESTSDSSSSNEIPKSTSSETNTDCGVKDSNSQQTLGAIGSERKFNHSSATINSDESGNEQVENNVLAQCWDFTLTHKGCELHSEHGHYVSLFKNKTNNEAAEKIDPVASEDTKILENEEELSKIEDINLISRCELITEINPDENKVKALIEEDLVEEIFSRKQDEATADRDIDSEEPVDEIVTDLFVREPDLSKESGNNDGASPKVTMFDAILNLLKSPNPVASDESATIIYEEVPIGENVNFEPFENQENPISSNDNKLASENDEEQKEEPSTSQESADLINLDVVDSPNEWNELGGTSDDRGNETTLKYVSTNPFRTEGTLTDNINSISWKESPFPIDGTKIPTVPVVENKRQISKLDAQTMTTLYDFNVAYVGGTSEPGYRELWGVSRSINEGTSINETIENQASNVITFDKSSMTGEIDILAGEADSSVEKEKDSTNRLDDLIEMFPHYPSEYLKTLYEQQCNCNFDWVVDVLLLADVPNLTIENYEKQSSSPKLCKIEHEKLKQRSHSSSPKNRRNRAKDFRSFSLDCVKDCARESDCDNNTGGYDDEDKLFELFYNKAVAEEHFSTPQNLDLSEAASISSNAAGANSDDDSSETMELDFGRDFINQLENTCGNPDFVLPDEFKPVIKIKKSMVDELYGLWIESMDHQMKVLHARLDERMAKDEAMARAVDREESVKMREPVVPNLEEIMNMEMALARYHNELKENVARETPNDMASRLTRQMLYELLPDIDKEMLSEILKAHGGNFKETCEIIEASIGRTVSKSDSLKKQQSLLERVHEESKNLDIQEESSSSLTTPIIVVNPDIRTCAEYDRYQYQDAISRGRNARLEAQIQASLRIENYNKAAEAYRKGQPEVAAYYSQMVKLHTENIKTAHANAADEFLAAQTFTQNGEDTLDLHNLFVREALQAVDIFLDYQSKKLNKSTMRSVVFFVITGHGARSNNGLGRIKPAVTKKLISKNIRFTESNPGCLKVTLNRRIGASD